MKLAIKEVRTEESMNETEGAFSMSKEEIVTNAVCLE